MSGNSLSTITCYTTPSPPTLALVKMRSQKLCALCTRCSRCVCSIFAVLQPDSPNTSFQIIVIPKSRMSKLSSIASNSNDVAPLIFTYLHSSINCMLLTFLVSLLTFHYIIFLFPTMPKLFRKALHHFHPSFMHQTNQTTLIATPAVFCSCTLNMITTSA